MIESVFIYIYGYIPGVAYGGPVTSIFNFTEYFGNKYNIYIVCSNHDHGSSEVYPDISKGWNRVGKANVMYLSEKEYKEEKFYELMKPLNVKMAYLTGVFSYRLNHAAIKACDRLNIKVVIATRGEICKNVLAMKSYKKLPYLQVMKWTKEYCNSYFQVTSNEELEQLGKYLAIAKDRVTMLPNIHGVRMDIPRPEKKAGIARTMFISRVHPKKNLLDVIKALAFVKGSVIFDIFGPIEEETYWQECQEAMKNVPENVKIQYCGKLDMNQARASYYNYHCFLFPTLTENYGHVIVESMIADCPFVISRGTTPWDDADGEAGYVVELHNIPAFTEAVQKIVDMSATEYEMLQARLRVYRDKKLKLKELLEEYEKLIQSR